MPKHPMRITPTITLPREIALLILCKLVVVALLYGLFFNPSKRPAIDAGRVDTMFFAEPKEALR